MHTLFHTLRCTAAYAGHLATLQPVPDNDVHRIPTKTHRVAFVIHGYLGRAVVMQELRSQLAKHRIDSVAVSAPIASALSFGRFKAITRTAIQELRAQHPHIERVDLIGHSMGGIVGAELIEEGALSGLDVTLTALGSPFLGTWTALFGAAVSTSARELLPTHPRARTSLTTGHGLSQTPFLSVAGGADFIAPPERCRHPHADHEVFPGIDHAGLLYRRRVINRVLHFLRAP